MQEKVKAQKERQRERETEGINETDKEIEGEIGTVG